jgi:NADP-dependent 3-hydroxy acid dehydrogenase YdfG
MVAVNLLAPFNVAKAFLPAMRQAGRGTFVTLGSVADHVGFPENAAYAASKFGVRGLHETLVAEYRGSGVNLSLVSPGPTDTSVWDPYDPDRRQGFVPRAGMLRPADVAEAIMFIVTRPAHVHIDWLRLGPTHRTG